jgi:gliding motility-associated-like protein
MFSCAQNEYYMANGLIRECNGIFKDSEDGLTAGHYNHNEDYIFTICVPGSNSISWDFSQFCTEQTYDFLQIFSGKDTTGTLQGTYSGTTGPGQFTINDSCVTFYFHSDNSVSCTGWEAEWTSRIVHMPTPSIARIPNQNCEIDSLIISLDQIFHCDSVTTSNFTLSGPVNSNVSGVSVLNCNSDSMGSRYRLNLSSPLDRSGTYRVDFSVNKLDICDSMWVLDTFVEFDITNCPIEVDIIPDDSTVCVGGCTVLNVEVTGGNPSNYTYHWISGNLNGPGPHTVCVTQNTTYILEVRDGVSVPGRDTFILEVTPPPQILDDTTLCRNNPIFRLWAQETGGFWEGNGVLDSSGRFRAVIAGVGNTTVRYTLNGCSDTAIISVLQITPGAVQGSCPGGNEFQLTGFAPSGGFWIGPHTDSSGRFNPIESGRFRVTYNAPNGCVASKWVNVDSLTVQRFDTMCTSDNWKELTFSPLGGRWAGAGIINTVLGRFDPQRTGPGDFVLRYNMNGCRDTTFMHVVPIDAGDTLFVCPEGGLISLPSPIPLNGNWSGTGVSATDSGYFDPSHLNDGQLSFIEYNQSGCSDRLYIRALQTKIDLDSISLCPYDLNIYLRSNEINPFPQNGTWSGLGIDEDTFFRNLVTPGVYDLEYESNNCASILKVFVIPEMTIMNDTSICDGDYILPLSSSDANAQWFGQGVQNPNIPQFNPNYSGVGNIPIYVRSSEGCFRTLNIEVTANPTIEIITESPYCNKDSNFIISALPDGGTLFGNGITQNFFNPIQIAQSQTNIYYEYGDGNCRIIDSVIVQILPPLQLDLITDKDSICPFDDVTIEVQASGGIAQNYQTTWSTGHQNQNSIYLFPTNTNRYQVNLSDGCSNPTEAEIEIIVNPLPEFTIEQSPIQCYGTLGFAEIIPLPNQNLVYSWNTFPPSDDARVVFNVGQTVRLNVVDQNTGCVLDTTVTLESYPEVRANFFVNNLGGCVSQGNEFLPISNLSIGGLTGSWQVSGFSIVPFEPGNNPQLEFDKTVETFTVSLRIENEFGCTDEMTREYCIRDTVIIHVPSVFSPNNDLINDVFKPLITDVRKYHLQIFNRWGEKVFESFNPEIGWDGRFKGAACQTGYYPYYIQYEGMGFFRGNEKGVLYLVR